MGYLYKLNFASGKPYIGMTNMRTVADRMRAHRCAANKGSKLAIHRAWRKYGEPKVTTLAIAVGAFLLELEQRAVLVYASYGLGGYNLTPGGDINPALTPESRAKRRAAMTGRKASLETRMKQSAARKGKLWSAESRAKLSVSKTGIKLSDETKAKISAKAKGRIITSEARAKMSASQKIKIFTAEHRANIAKAKTGSKHSPETIAKLTGRVFSVEHCARISAAKKGVLR